MIFLSNVNEYGDVHRAPCNDGAWQKDFVDGKLTETLDIGGGYSVNLVDFFAKGIEPYKYCRQDMEYATDYDNGYSKARLEYLERMIQKAVQRGANIPMVTIYRTVPGHVQGEDNIIHDGDWVTLSPSYARMHGGLRYTDDFHVLSKVVPANHVYWDGQHLCEFGYDSRLFEWNKLVVPADVRNKEEHDQERVLYHITLSENIPSIRARGLIPKIGERSKEFGESDPGVFLFTSKEGAYNALSNWLGEWYDMHLGEECQLDVLSVRLPSDIVLCESAAAYEKICKHIIPPDCISIVDQHGKEIPILQRSSLYQQIQSASARLSEEHSTEQPPAKDLFTER